MGIYDNPDGDDYSPPSYRDTQRSSKTISDDGVSVSTPNSPQAKEIASTKRVFFWLFSITFVVFAIVILISYIYIAFSDKGKELPATDILVTILKIIANILMGLGSGN